MKAVSYIFEGETFTLEDVKTMMGLARADAVRGSSTFAGAFGYLMEAANLSYTLSMGGQYMATNVVVTLAPKAVVVSVKCSKQEMVYAIVWADLKSCRIKIFSVLAEDSLKRTNQLTNRSDHGLRIV